VRVAACCGRELVSTPFPEDGLATRRFWINSTGQVVAELSDALSVYGAVVFVSSDHVLTRMNWPAWYNSTPPAGVVHGRLIHFSKVNGVLAQTSYDLPGTVANQGSGRRRVLKSSAAPSSAYHPVLDFGGVFRRAGDRWVRLRCGARLRRHARNRVGCKPCFRGRLLHQRSILRACRLRPCRSRQAARNQDRVRCDAGFFASDEILAGGHYLYPGRRGRR
jgi:hypothetical protein